MTRDGVMSAQFLTLVIWGYYQHVTLRKYIIMKDEEWQSPSNNNILVISLSETATCKVFRIYCHVRSIQLLMLCFEK